MNAYDLEQLIHDIHAKRAAIQSLHPERTGVKKYADDLVVALRDADKELKEAEDEEDRKKKATALRVIAVKARAFIARNERAAA